ncbi:hypothetical protein WICPIJ_009873 [Wickerhamomyces pijperi]|uniref:Uncharacterized protein n=1 Tax=Wickerhamomyces pijperi TaxID=599730 RepID=A0A9P8PKV5_WICPI|nr:hypothetical protein WICPIJ_009873 [Wickerhamomyces pijperi]
MGTTIRRMIRTLSKFTIHRLLLKIHDVSTQETNCWVLETDRAEVWMSVNQLGEDVVKSMWKMNQFVDTWKCNSSKSQIVIRGGDILNKL